MFIIVYCNSYINIRLDVNTIKTTIRQNYVLTNLETSYGKIVCNDKSFSLDYYWSCFCYKGVKDVFNEIYCKPVDLMI